MYSDDQASHERASKSRNVQRMRQELELEEAEIIPYYSGC